MQPTSRLSATAKEAKDCLSEKRVIGFRWGLSKVSWMFGELAQKPWLFPDNFLGDNSVVSFATNRLPQIHPQAARHRYRAAPCLDISERVRLRKAYRLAEANLPVVEPRPTFQMPRRTPDKQRRSLRPQLD
jgi:hypothetical protein